MWIEKPAGVTISTWTPYFRLLVYQEPRVSGTMFVRNWERYTFKVDLNDGHPQLYISTSRLPERTPTAQVGQTGLSSSYRPQCMSRPLERTPTAPSRPNGRRYSYYHQHHYYYHHYYHHYYHQFYHHHHHDHHDHLLKVGRCAHVGPVLLIPDGALSV
jgi:hypothetical protein